MTELDEYRFDVLPSDMDTSDQALQSDKKKSKESTTPSSRRRMQNREAQRAYRSRQIKLIDGLKDELLRLHGENRVLAKKNSMVTTQLAELLLQLHHGTTTCR